MLNFYFKSLTYTYSLNIVAKSGALAVSWGRRCKDYKANFTIAFTAQAKSSALDCSLSWDETPPYFRTFHYKICALEYMVRLSWTIIIKDHASPFSLETFILTFSSHTLLLAALGRVVRILSTLFDRSPALSHSWTPCSLHASTSLLVFLLSSFTPCSIQALDG